MSDALVVLLGDQVAGTLTRLNGGQLRFDYDRDYRESEAPTPLSLSVPARIASHPDRVVTPWLWGLLPDNQAVLRRWVRELQASASSLGERGTKPGARLARARYSVAAESRRELTIPLGAKAFTLARGAVPKRAGAAYVAPVVVHATVTGGPTLERRFYVPGLITRRGDLAD